MMINIYHSAALLLFSSLWTGDRKGQIRPEYWGGGGFPMYVSLCAAFTFSVKTTHSPHQKMFHPVLPHVRHLQTPTVTDTSLSQGSLVNWIRSSRSRPCLTLPLLRPLHKQKSDLLNHDKPQSVAQSNSSEFLFYFLRVVVYAGSKTVFCVVCKASD